MRDFDEIYREVQIPQMMEDLWEYQLHYYTINELTSLAKKSFIRELVEGSPTPQATYERLKSRMDALGMPINTLKIKEN